MKKLYLFFTLCLFTSIASAQLPDGSIAPDWTITDLNGGTHNLYDVLESGKSVVIDFSATWCPPCWSYHQTHIMEDIYNEYGPNGSISPNTIEMYYIESDSGTNDPCMTNSPGCTGGTQGDWTAGTSYHLSNPPTEAIRLEYGVSSYPTLLAVCPNKKLYEVGQASKATWESWIVETCALDQDFLTTDIECFGDGGGGIDLTVSGGAGSVQFSWSNGAQTEDLTNVSAGMYSCTITEGRGHSIETGPIMVGGPAAPVGTSGESITNVLCSGESNGSISVTASGGVGNYSYSWSNGATTPMISGLSGSTYTVIITDGDGCTGEQSFVVEEPLEVLPTTAEAPATCGNSNGFVSISPNGGTGPYIYDIGVDFNSTGVFANIPSGIYFGSVTDVNGCSAPIQFLIDDIPAPLAMAVGGETITCENSEVMISGEGSEEGGPITYNWATSNGVIISGGNTLNPIVGSAGEYTLQVLDNSTGCFATATVNVTEDINAPLAATSDDAVLDCANTEATLSGQGSSMGDNFTYLWSTSNGNILSDPTSLEIEVNAGGQYTLEVINTENGCSSVSSVSVEQSADVPVSNAGSSQALTCVVSEVTLDGTASSDGDQYVYTWSTTDGMIVSGTDLPTAVAGASGTYLLEVLNTENGCAALSSVEVIVDTAEPQAMIAEPTVLTCVLEEQTLAVDVDLVGDYTLDWTTNDGNIVSGSDTDQPLVDAPGEYMLLVINNENGCSATYSVIVGENINTPAAAYDFENDDKTFMFSDVSTGEPVTYVWDFGDGNTSTEQNPTHIYADNGDYEVCLTITNECDESTTCNTVTVSSGASLQYALDSANPLCFGVCEGSYDVTPAEEVDLYTIMVTGENYSSPSFSASDLCAGDYSFVLTNDIGESIEGVFTIDQPQELSVSEQQIVNVACNGEESGSIALTLVGGTGIVSVTWEHGPEGTLLEDLPAGDYVANVVDENGCAKQLNYSITEAPALDLESSNVTNIDDNNPSGAIEISVEGGTGEYSYLWSNGDQTQNIDGLGIGEYEVIVTDESGCKETFGPFTVQQLVSVNEIDDLETFRLSPNPATDLVVIQLDFADFAEANISIINNLGQLVSQNVVSGQAIRFSQDISGMTSGLYFVRIDVGGQSTIKKLIVE